MRQAVAVKAGVADAKQCRRANQKAGEGVMEKVQSSRCALKQQTAGRRCAGHVDRKSPHRRVRRDGVTAGMTQTVPGNRRRKRRVRKNRGEAATEPLTSDIDTANNALRAVMRRPGSYSVRKEGVAGARAAQRKTVIRLFVCARR